MLASVLYKDRPFQPVPAVEINHGVDGWVLVDMDWNPDSGLAVYDYVQYDNKGKFLAAASAIVLQPYNHSHEGWHELWNRPEAVFVVE